MRRRSDPCRSPRLAFETLESRTMLSAAQLIDLETEPLGDGPGTATVAGGQVYFQQEGQLWRMPPGGEPQIAVDQHFVSPEGLWQIGGRLLYRTTEGVWSFEPGADQSTLIIPRQNSLPSFTSWGERLVVSISNELWLTDGTLAGTKQSLDASWSLFASYWAELGDELLFAAYTDGLGKELWKIDAAGDAQFIKDIWPNGLSSQPDQLIAAGGWVYFTANDGVHGRELWRTDGSETGTQMVAETYPGDSNYPSPSNVTLLGDYLYYNTSDLTHGRELFRTNVHTGATTLAAEMAPGAASSAPLDLIAHDGVLYFTATVDSIGRSAMKYDPQTGVTTNLAPGQSWEWLEVYAAGDRVYFLAAARGVNSGNFRDWQVLVSDGTAAGTTAVATPTLTRETIWPQVFNEGADGLTMAFAQIGAQPVWRVSPAGVVDAGSAETSLQRVQSVRAGETRLLLFTSSTTSGSPRGDLWSIGLADNDLEPLGAADRDTFFAIRDSVAYYNGWDAQAGHALWSTDGSPEGTAVEADLDLRTAGSTLYYGGGNSATFNGEHYFALGNNGAELWASDGTPEGTRRVVLLGQATPRYLTPFGDSLYFIAGNAGPLWRVAPSGDAQPVVDVAASRMHLIGDALYLEGTIGGVRGLYRNAGAGFTLIRAAYQVNGANGGFSTHPVEHAGRVFYHFGNIYREDLYVQDLQTGASTKLVDFRTIAWMYPFGDGVVFSKRDNNVGDYDLWYSDGTVEGTRSFDEFMPAHDDSSSYFPLFELHGYHYFRIETAEHGAELWRNDGTAGSGELVMDIHPGSASSFPTSVHVLGERILFLANDGMHGREWWVIDDAASAPRLLKDIYEGERSGVPTTSDTIHRSGNHVYFTGDDPDRGREVWRTDGTAAGTILLHDVEPGPNSSQPRSYAVADGMLFYHADDGVHGRELWTLPLGSIPTPGDYDADGQLTHNDYAVWRSTYGSTTDLRADGNHDGRVDAADYSVWRDRMAAAESKTRTNPTSAITAPAMAALAPSANSPLDDQPTSAAEFFWAPPHTHESVKADSQAHEAAIAAWAADEQAALRLLALRPAKKLDRSGCSAAELAPEPAKPGEVAPEALRAVARPLTPPPAWAHK